MRIFRQEQALVSGSLTGIVRNLESSPHHQGQYLVCATQPERDRSGQGQLPQGAGCAVAGPSDRYHEPASLRAAQERAGAEGERFWLLLFDIDHFKGLNDSRGHAFGDQVLCRVANCLADVLG